MLVDCHCHVHATDFDADRSEVRRRAFDAGIHTALVVGEDLEDSRRVLAMCDDAQEGLTALLPCVGIHPDRWCEDRPPPSREELEAVFDLVRTHRRRLAAIGEVGLDRRRAEQAASRAAQCEALERFVALSLELHLTLNVHSRSAGHYTLDLLRSAGARHVLMHAFDGKASYAVRAADDGFVFSIPPSVVRSPQKQKLVRALPLESLALESDAPVLGPIKDQRNEPANLRHTVKAIADIHGTSTEEVGRVTTNNARRLFPLLRDARATFSAD